MSSPFDGLSRLDEDSIRQIKYDFPRLPVGYLDFLREYGWGIVGAELYSVYERPVSSKDIYGEKNAVGSQVVILADNFAGYCVACDTRSGALLGIAPPQQVERLDQTFTEFLKAELGLQEAKR